MDSSAMDSSQVEGVWGEMSGEAISLLPAAATQIVSSPFHAFRRASIVSNGWTESVTQDGSTMSVVRRYGLS
jgi:hypothetical protein